MEYLDIFSSAMQLVWPLLAIATFVVCLQIQSRHNLTKGTSLLVAGSALMTISSLTNTVLSVLIINGTLEISPITYVYSLTGLLSLAGQLLFLIGLYHFGMARRADRYDDLLDDLPD